MSTDTVAPTPGSPDAPGAAGSSARPQHRPGTAAPLALVRRLKGWPGWLLLLVVLVALLTIGTTRDGGPRTAQERIDAITKQLACPACDGESVYESRATAAEAIRTRVAELVAEGTQSDGEILATIDSAYATSLRLVPRSSGFEALVWVMPATVLVLSIAGLAVAFRRWRGQLDTAPSDDDRALVEAALRAGGEVAPHGGAGGPAADPDPGTPPAADPGAPDGRLAGGGDDRAAGAGGRSGRGGGPSDGPDGGCGGLGGLGGLSGGEGGGGR